MGLTERGVGVFAGLSGTVVVPAASRAVTAESLAGDPPFRDGPGSPARGLSVRRRICRPHVVPPRHAFQRGVAGGLWPGDCTPRHRAPRRSRRRLRVGRPRLAARRLTLIGHGVSRVVAWQDAVEPEGEGCAVLIEVGPGARTMLFPAGYNEWRNCIGIKVHAPPREGKANREVEAEIARFFHVPPSRVKIERGHADTRKRVVVAGLPRDAALARLAEALT